MSPPPPPPSSLNVSSPYSVSSPFNSKIMVAAIIVLFFVVFLIAALHLYARWFWHRTYYITPRAIPFTSAAARANPLAANTGLDKTVLSQLPTFVFVKAPTTPASTEALEFATEDIKDPSAAPRPLLECAVCLSEFEDGEKGRMLPSCNHAFHIECIDMWFHSHSTCPLCRTVVSPSPSVNTDEQTHDQGETAQGESVEAAMPVSDGNGDAIPASAALQYPCNVLFYGNQAQVTSHMTSAKDPSSSHLPPSPSSSGRANRPPHITIEVPSTQGNFVMSPSPHGGEQAALKSPSLRLSIKRMLSRQSSRQRNEGFEEYQKGATSAV